MNQKINCVVCTFKKKEHCHQVCKGCIIKSGKKECPVCRQVVKLSEKESDKCDYYFKQLLLDNLKEYNPYLQYHFEDSKLLDLIVTQFNNI